MKAVNGTETPRRKRRRVIIFFKSSISIRRIYTVTDLYTESQIPLSLLIELEMTGIPTNQTEVSEYRPHSLLRSRGWSTDTAGRKRVYTMAASA
jgi:hypothetical protein